jgi:Tat protein secretion system quality control protein TatD with DNase activity
MIDGHAHLNEIEEIDEAIERARRLRVRGIVAVGMDIESNRDTLTLAKRFPDLVQLGMGYHPWSITLENVEENLSFIEANIKMCVAMVEIGLDYGAKAKKRLQQQVFQKMREF